ncbi:MAG: M28 family peptidase [Dysgonamonadaceae bacterium]
MKQFRIVPIGMLSIMLLACGCSKKATSASSNDNFKYEQVSPAFNADSAYQYVAAQVNFGTRVTNSKGHAACGDYLVAQLNRFGATVTEQKSTAKAFDGTTLNIRNIIGSFNPEQTNRIALFAHWDTRPFADHDPDAANQHQPILGANDGASGVGVLLEVARAIQKKTPGIGVDIIFFDAEDYGEAAFAENVPKGDWWCLGSQYWSKHPHKEGYKARFGILLDMVGAPDATFYKEGFSMENAADVVEKVWSNARMLGYGKYFIDGKGGSITDDHVPVNQNAGIPTIDIIQFDPNSESGFGWYWHTTKDNMDNISKETLKAVGQTIMEVIYKEQ